MELVSGSSAPTDITEDKPDVQSIITAIDNDLYSNDELTMLTKALGAHQHGQLSESITNKSCKYKNRDYLININNFEYLQNTNSVLVSFLTALTGIGVSSTKKIRVFNEAL